MEYSHLQLNARDIDEKRGIVSFYFANFQTPDTNKRIMHKNAFNRTFNASADRLKHYKNHDRGIVLGKVLELGKDEKGSFAVSQLSKSDEGRNMLVQYNEGLINEHSFGFEILNSHPDGDIEVVDEVRLWEVSTMTGWGAHADTPMISLNALEEKIDAIEKAMELHTEIKDKLDQLLNKIALAPADKHRDPLVKEDVELINFINNYNY